MQEQRKQGKPKDRRPQEKTGKKVKLALKSGQFDEAERLTYRKAG